jgi:hypothetical protein
MGQSSDTRAAVGPIKGTPIAGKHLLLMAAKSAIGSVCASVNNCGPMHRDFFASNHKRAQPGAANSCSADDVREIEWG